MNIYTLSFLIWVLGVVTNSTQKNYEYFHFKEREEKLWIWMCSRLSSSPIEIRNLTLIKSQSFLEKQAMTRRDKVAKVKLGTRVDVKATLLPYDFNH